MSIEAERDMELLPALRAAELDYTLEWGSGDLYGAAADEIERLRAALDAALAATPKPLDDPRLQGLFSDAISGALAFGAQNTNPPPAGHWLERFWQMGRAERALSEAPPAAEPVAWIDPEDMKVALQDDGWCVVHASQCDPGADHNANVPLYTAAPAVPQTEPAPHKDDIAVDRFAAAMKAKLARKRVDGRGGWDHRTRCTNDSLAGMLLDHVAKGDPVDIANLAMMIHQRDEQGIENMSISNLPGGLSAIGFAAHMRAKDAPQTEPAPAVTAEWQRGYNAGYEAGGRDADLQHGLDAPQTEKDAARLATFDRLIGVYAEACQHRASKGMRSGYIALRDFALGSTSATTVTGIGIVPEYDRAGVRLDGPAPSELTP
jgi:hypothetical protein